MVDRARRALAVSVSWFVALALAGAASIEEPRACAIGAKPGPFALLDQRYLPRTLDEFAVDRALVLVFTTCECPLAGKAMPRIAELAATYRERGVRFALVNADPNETVADAATFALAHGVIVPVLDDPKMAAARALGVTHSPQVVVLDGSLTLRYRGRVDASTRVTGTAARAGRADLREAIDDVLANGKVRVAETPVEGCVLTLERPAPPATPVTWSQDVAPLMHRHCAECHHDGGQGPFALVAYEDVAKRAAMIAEVVRQKRMPPWFGTTGSEDFANHRGLEDREIRTLEAFAAQGAPVGDLDRAPPAPTFAPREWRIGEPDLVLTQLGRAELPASGIVPYHYTVFPHLFTEDTWVEAVEIKGANPRVLHHCNLAFYELGQKFKMENFITGLVPGGDPMDLDPGTAVLIPAGSVLGAEIHYVTSGKPEVDEVSVALRFPKTKVRKRLHCHQIADFRFAIPPGAEAHAVNASRTLKADSRAVGVFVHMHLRGRDMTFVANTPDGARETLLVVPNYDFEWQQSYRYPREGKFFPAGTRIDVTAHFDNSAFNVFNPDPSATVKFGRQTTDEMMYGFFFYVEEAEDLALNVDAKNGTQLD